MYMDASVNTNYIILVGLRVYGKINIVHQDFFQHLKKCFVRI